MFIQRRSTRPRGRPDRDKLTFAGLAPRLREFYLAALAHHGEVARISRALRLSQQGFVRRLSALRTLGLVQTRYLVNPRRRGLEYECLVLVRLSVHSAATLADFEAWCMQDTSITSAVRICGRFDYQLTTYHRDHREAERWRRIVQARPEVGQLEQRQVRTIHGHQLGGLPLRQNGIGEHR